ncbi:MAG: leucine-rich repeat domain-containing protein, partial [Prevotella sp.]|nr:leucine-rich repeat domain-containing protein [Prevotella sp.]
MDGHNAEGDIVVPEYVTIKGRQYRVTKIGTFAFKKRKKIDSKAENTNLKSIRLPNSITRIGVGAFEYCTALTHVVMSNNLRHINVSAFSCCTSLVEITLPNCLTGLCSYAFEYC